VKIKDRRFRELNASLSPFPETGQEETIKAGRSPRLSSESPTGGGRVARDERTSKFNTEEIRYLLRKLMWEKVGIIRCEESLAEAKKRLKEWSFILEKTFVTRRELELKNMIEVSGLITEAALLRKGSTGAHYRSDYPQRGEGWDKHIMFKKEAPENEFAR
jgi:succinate dehydrogenase/fumarate reductase flavoprotein subunit